MKKYSLNAVLPLFFTLFLLFSFSCESGGSGEAEKDGNDAEQSEVDSVVRLVKWDGSFNKTNDTAKFNFVVNIPLDYKENIQIDVTPTDSSQFPLDAYPPALTLYNNCNDFVGPDSLPVSRLSSTCIKAGITCESSSFGECRDGSNYFIGGLVVVVFDGLPESIPQWNNYAYTLIVPTGSDEPDIRKPFIFPDRTSTPDSCPKMESPSL